MTEYAKGYWVHVEYSEDSPHYAGEKKEAYTTSLAFCNAASRMEILDFEPLIEAEDKDEAYLLKEPEGAVPPSAPLLSISSKPPGQGGAVESITPLTKRGGEA